MSTLNYNLEVRCVFFFFVQNLISFSNQPLTDVLVNKTKPLQQNKAFVTKQSPLRWLLKAQSFSTIFPLFPSK